MAHHEASTTVDVAANIVFEYLSDLQHLPQFLPRMTDVHPTEALPADAQGIEARRPQQPVHHELEVTADDPSGQPVHREAWIDVVEENRTLRWGSPGNPGYHGELEVDFVADGTSHVTVRLDTSHPASAAIDNELANTLTTLKTTLEHTPPTDASHTPTA
ncbi:SRPBCC family protein [Kribbella catacumbae]|uniref:SRPBCC family protein n=1 Tax=Kribbella catacumbae TaxID=460086 RepID=UPI0003A54D80|nr:SRPBCC family protein [Kribbella catacumbae]